MVKTGVMKYTMTEATRPPMNTGTLAMPPTTEATAAAWAAGNISVPKTPPP